MSYQVLARKWRPQNFIELAGQDHVLQALVNALKQQRLHHAYLFTGTRGVGKTTIARIFAKCLNCETNGISPEPCGTCGSCVEIAEGRFVDLIEVDAASRTKVEDTRELLENVQYTPTRGRFKVYLIDEVHMLSTHSFNALLKTLEEPPAHVKFLLATTDPQKLPVTILSRCLQFNLKNMSPGRVVSYLEKILTTEQLSYDEAGLWQIGQAANGSMRDALSLTDQAIAFGNGHISESDVTSMLGLVNQAQVVKLLETVVQSDAAKLLTLINELAEYQPDFIAICASLLDLLHRIAIEQQVPNALEDQLGDLASVKMIAQQVSSETIQLFYQTLLIGKRDLPLAHSPKAGFEMLLLRLIAFRPAASVALSSVPVSEQIQAETGVESNPVVTQETAAPLTASNAKPQIQETSNDSQSSQVSPPQNISVEDAQSLDTSLQSASLNEDIKHEVTDAVELASNIGESQSLNKDQDDHVNKESSEQVNSNISTEEKVESNAQKVTDSRTNEQTPPFEPDEKPKPLNDAEATAKMADISRLVNDVETEKDAIGEVEPIQEVQSQSAAESSTKESVLVEGDENDDDEIEEIGEAVFDRSAELVAVMQSEAITITNPVEEDAELVIEEKPIATNQLDVSFTKAEVIVQPALGMDVETLNHFSELTMQVWWLIAPRLPLTGLVQNILMNSCMLEAGEQGIKLEVPLEYGHMLNQVRYEQIQDAVSHYFNETVPLIIDTVADVSGVTAEEFAASKRAQAMQEAIDHLNAHPIVMALSSTMGGQLIYDSVKIKA
ncbi:DNA polymerase III subunit gamma/tau [Marinomonas sp. S3726]|uniref:DNA polymerase III subunit gamma/tau n=1 Tax=Marinomonas sp. S3726 TaxID=579484 RepID=UPI0005F9DEB1|nr:DNA polymerase III subunit gamma/tau [Marinomonas sp. S3726]KJZ12486.1 DNA polymerase III subunit gamma/tau [Marinomonas sp. S3726]